MVAAIADLQPQAYTGTPPFLRILLDKAQELGLPIPITKLRVEVHAVQALPDDGKAINDA